MNPSDSTPRVSQVASSVDVPSSLGEAESLPAAVTRRLSEPFPSRGAAEVLARRVRDLLRSGAVAAGDRFLTDEELVAVTSLSRSTVRRALAGLRSEGWLQSQAGLGTYVGRAVVVAEPQPKGASSVRSAPSLGGLRLGMIAFSEQTPSYDWVKPAVLRGIHEVADKYDARVELLTGMSRSGATLDDGLRRIERSGVDAIVCLSVDPSDALLLRSASERGLRCFLAGTAFPDLPVPRVCEDNRAGMDDVVRRVAGLGHERIGLVMRRWPSPWLFKRHEQWHDTRRELGLPLDEGLMHWLPQADEPMMAESTFSELASWIERAQPTAVVCGHWAPALHLGQLLRNGAFRVPDDFSLVVIDQYPEVPSMLGVQPATLEVPLVEIGRTLVRLAAGWVEDQAPPSLTKLPMVWRDGDTLVAR
ncbi:MAG: substrate-binding domain-containing protein [Planctomycetota bacterium]